MKPLAKLSLSPRLETVLHLSCFLVFLYSLSMPIPMLVGILAGEQDLSAFFITFIAAFILGAVGWLGTAEGDKNLKTRDGFLITVLFWIIFSIISTAPLYLDKRLGLSFSQALFEGISGITTTGASVLDNIDELPKSILYYRAQLNFLGGLGIIVLAVAVMPFLGIGGAKLYQAEMPGPLKEERFTPRLADTAVHLWIIYSALAALCGLAYYLAGMNGFDALCHSLSTVSLGGFSTHAASLGYFNSRPIELVGGVFSILAAVNFSLYFVAISQRSVKAIYRNAEFRFFLKVLSAVVLVTCVELYRLQHFSLVDAWVHGFFQAASIMTDNGLGAADYPAWPEHTVLLLLVASFFGGCVGSTCGGIKAMRILLLYKQGIREIKQLIHPNAVLATKIGSTSAPDRVIRSVWALFFLYLLCSWFFIWGLSLLGYDLSTAFGTVAACINNMGVGYGETAAGFGGLNDPAKWLMCLAMLMGRLEIFPILIVFSRSFWRL